MPHTPGKDKLASMISQIKNAFTSVNWGSVGMNIISGIASGISSAVGSLISAATFAASSALDAIKSKLGIHSPSRVFRDQVGKMMALGMGIGFEKNIPVGSMNAGVQKAVQSLQRSVQLLYFFGELNYEQIAELEGCKYQAVQSSIYAAIKTLKKFLK